MYDGFMNEKGFKHCNRGIVHSQIKYTVFKSSKKSLKFWEFFEDFSDFFFLGGRGGGLCTRIFF